MGLACAVMVVVSLFTLERRPAPMDAGALDAAAAGGKASLRRGSDSGTDINTISSTRQAV